MGDMLWRLGRYQESAARLEDAHKILQQLKDGSTAPLNRLSLVRAQALLSQLRPRAARLQARAAVPSADRQSALRVLEAQAALGLALARSGQGPEGRQWCERALRTAQQADIPAGISGAKLALAEAALASGDPRTGELAEEARIYSVQSGHRESAFQARLVKWNFESHRNGAAAAAQSAAAFHAASKELEAMWGPGSLAAYLQRPDLSSMIRASQ
jgi:hypothetical protein